MIDGLYSVFFQSNTSGFGVGANIGSGVVTAKDNAINGGDFAFFYQGRIEGERLRLHVKQFNAQGTSVFGGLNDFFLNLVVHEQATGQYVLDGTMEGQAQLNLRVVAHKISELVA
ncbi:GrlR family regulatory protein [Pluralibacter gergoviae]|uniref:GrlR family regulatory protein n=1 Tax=Pluralibacter gergoviae TaxID=61647 RepID=A0AAW8HVM0_PLUGE|nr:GrlR family regulatory protein [Pluralibacter gergoviae]AVR02983.1 negative regulator GrlR [Pluralibacter gergoviae]KMK01566.1 hypothetical protein ABW08_22790 [Pluralibacter gergoviae]MDQ2312458.1 GrlR family regulatory protein [Pluralibacter gergoviae]